MSADTLTSIHVTAGEVASDAIGADARTVIALFDDVMTTAEPADVHACRVAVRRLRADVRTFRPLLDRRWVGDRRRDLHSLHRTLATVRHLDVRAEHLRAAGARADGRDDEVAAVLGDLADVRHDAVAALPVTLTADTRAWLRRLADEAESTPVHPDPGSDAHVEA
ncbi:MAG: CHAD domain-containing protein, partial [Ilumatobacteraceae bacterium]